MTTLSRKQFHYTFLVQLAALVCLLLASMAMYDNALFFYRTAVIFLLFFNAKEMKYSGGIFVGAIVLTSLPTSFEWLSFLTVAILFLYRKRLHIDGSACFLLLLGGALSAFSPMYSHVMVKRVCLLFPFAYMAGYSMLSFWSEGKSYKQSQTIFRYVLLLVALGLTVHTLLNFLIYNRGESRDTIDFWSGQKLAATGQAALGAIVVGVAIATFFSHENIYTKLVTLVVFGIVMAYNLVLAGRTLLFMAVIVFIFGFAFTFLTSKNRKRRRSILIVMFSAIAAIALLYLTNPFGFRDWVNSTNMYKRFFGEKKIPFWSTPRWAQKWYHLKRFFQQPFGGGYKRLGGDYAHDIILDTYDEGGIFALIGVVGYLVYAARRAIQCVFRRDLSRDTRVVVLCVYLAFFIIFLLEPILQGMQWLFILFCLIDGTLTRLLEGKKEIRSFAPLYAEGYRVRE